MKCIGLKHGIESFYDSSAVFHIKCSMIIIPVGMTKKSKI